jgi:uncharacterized spore protein YtfJ
VFGRLLTVEDGVIILMERQYLPKEGPMDVESIVGQARDAITVKRVFGDPYEGNGVTVIPAATVKGGAGGGGGEGTGPEGQGQGRGEGSGFGLTAKPAGAYVIQGDSVRWQPAVDVNRIVLGAQVVAVVALLTLRAVLRHAGRRSR